MASKSGPATGEPERKRQRRLPPSSSQSSSESSGVPSSSRTVSAKSPSPTAPSPSVASSSASDQAEAQVTTTSTDPHNWRGVRSRESLEMLQGDHFTVNAGPPCPEPKQKWVLSRKLLTSHSPYFACIPSGITEATPWVSNATFRLFAQWLYLGQLDIDDVNVSSETLVQAWSLGSQFRCPAFRDHVMVQLINSHRERGIKPKTLRDSLEDFSTSTKLRNWAIDQFYTKIAYGYVGYDDQKEDNPSDKGKWKKYAQDVKVFGRDFLEAYLDADQRGNRAKKPWKNGQKYMEVLKFAEIGVSKEKGGSMKAEATLVKAEGR